jgi:hypothetical protein
MCSIALTFTAWNVCVYIRRTDQNIIIQWIRKVTVHLIQGVGSDAHKRLYKLEPGPYCSLSTQRLSEYTVQWFQEAHTREKHHVWHQWSQWHSRKACRVVRTVGKEPGCLQLSSECCGWNVWSLLSHPVMQIMFVTHHKKRQSYMLPSSWIFP